MQTSRVSQAQLLKSMTDKIESAPAESSLFKHRGHIINNYIQTTHDNLNASIDVVVAAAEVPPEENDPSSIVAYYREQLNTVKASFDASYAELAEIEVTRNVQLSNTKEFDSYGHTKLH